MEGAKNNFEIVEELSKIHEILRKVRKIEQNQVKNSMVFIVLLAKDRKYMKFPCCKQLAPVVKAVEFEAECSENVPNGVLVQLRIKIFIF